MRSIDYRRGVELNFVKILKTKRNPSGARTLRFASYPTLRLLYKNTMTKLYFLLQFSNVVRLVELPIQLL